MKNKRSIYVRIILVLAIFVSSMQPAVCAGSSATCESTLSVAINKNASDIYRAVDAQAMELKEAAPMPLIDDEDSRHFPEHIHVAKLEYQSKRGYGYKLKKVLAQYFNEYLPEYYFGQGMESKRIEHMLSEKLEKRMAHPKRDVNHARRNLNKAQLLTSKIKNVQRVDTCLKQYVRLADALSARNYYVIRSRQKYRSNKSHVQEHYLQHNINAAIVAAYNLLSTVKILQEECSAPELREEFKVVRKSDYIFSLPMVKSLLDYGDRYLYHVSERREDYGHLADGYDREIAKWEYYQAVFDDTPDSRRLTAGFVDMLRVSMAEFIYSWGCAKMLREGYCIPTNSDTVGSVKLTQAWHPVVGTRNTCWPLDIAVGSDGERPFYGITGSNEAGKSTTIEIIGLAVLYAYMGLPVPAQAAEIGKFNNIYSIAPGFEEIRNGESHHSALVQQMARMIKRARPGDLIIIDEAHMGSDYKDLVAVTTVLMEDLIKTGATIVYATHLKETMHRLKKVFNDIEPKSISITNYLGRRMIAPGVTVGSFAIETLRRLGYPDIVLEWMMYCYEQLMEREPQRERRAMNKNKDHFGERSQVYEQAADKKLLEEVFRMLYPGKFFANAYSFEHYRHRVADDYERWRALDDDTVMRLRKRIISNLDRTAVEINAHEGTQDTFDYYVNVLRGIKQHNNNQMQGVDSALKELQQQGFVSKELFETLSVASRHLSRREHYHIKRREFEGMSKDDAKKKFQRLRNELMEDHNKVMRSLYANGLGYIDCMIGIQVAVRQGNLAMPTGCSRGEAFTVRNARSPFVTDPVAIDLDGSNAHPQFIISGANKSGKTEAIRTLQAIILLAKEKLPVPADARIPGYDRTLTFFGEKEHMEKSESYFRSVSKRLLSILEDATKDSIVIMDELHGSDYWELSALQAAIIRYLDTIGATVVLNTHMREGLALIRDCSSVRFMKTDTIRNPDDTLTFNYALLPDKKLTAKSYGIESVRNYLTDDQTRRAFAIRQGLETIEEMRKRSYPVSDVLKSA